MLAISAVGARFVQADETQPKTPVVQAIEIIAAKEASPLEQLAARELEAYIARLSDAQVELRAEPGDAGKHLILLGSPATNPALKKLTGGQWPKLSDQGIYLKSIPSAVPKGRDILIVGGGSPVATLWAVHDLAERWGVVHLLSGDNFPDEKQLIDLKDLDLTRTPDIGMRIWRMPSDSPASGISWSLQEYQPLLAQLARLKFNHLMLEIHATQPFLDYEAEGIHKKTGVLWEGEEFRVDGETPGRDAFAGAEVFQNDDLPNEETDEDRVAAGEKYIRKIREAAEAQGINVTVSYCPWEFPLEFAPALEGMKTERVGNKLVLTLDKTSAKRAAPLVDAKIRAAHKLNDSIMSRWPSGVTPDAAALKLLGQHLAEQPAAFRIYELRLPRSETDPTELILSEIDRGVLAQLPFTELAKVIAALPNQGPNWIVSADVLGELDTAAIYISRAAFDPKLTPQEVSTEIFTTLTGQPDSAERTWRALVAIDELTQLAASNELNELVRPDAELFARLYKAEPLPESFEKIVAANGTTTTELYRARSNCLKRGSSVLYYYAKRGEYVGFYLAAVKALREAAVAKAAGDKDLALEKLEVALEAVNDSLSTYGDVAQNPSDRGLIALLAARLYRPLVVEYEQMLDAAESTQ